MSEKKLDLDPVVYIGFDVRLSSGKRIEQVFLRKEKIAELLSATDPLGAQLRALADAAKVQSPRKPS